MVLPDRGPSPLSPADESAHGTDRFHGRFLAAGHKKRPSGPLCAERAALRSQRRVGFSQMQLTPTCVQIHASGGQLRSLLLSNINLTSLS